MQGIQCFSILFRFLFELDEPLINVSDATNIFLYIRLLLSSSLELKIELLRDIKRK